MTNKRYLSYADVNSQVLSIAQQITTDGWKPDYVVGLTRGGLLPAVLLSHWFNVPCHTLKVSLRDDGSDNESNWWMAEDAFGYDEKHFSPGSHITLPVIFWKTVLGGFCSMPVFSS